MASHHKHNHRQIKHKKHEWVEKSPSVVPADIQAALKTAMGLEKVPLSDFNDLLWIMAQESGGDIHASNNKSSARGLFELLRAQHDMYPHGEQSLGNAVEECQGGIRYILGRYHSVKAARIFWEKNHWY